MMGRLKSDQGQLFYEFHLGDAVPEDLWCGRSIDSDFHGLGADLALGRFLFPCSLRVAFRSFFIAAYPGFAFEEDGSGSWRTLKPERPAFHTSAAVGDTTATTAAGTSPSINRTRASV